MRPNVAVVVFPGSNCEQDVLYALRREGADADYVWHGDDDLGDADAVVLPGGFAHGDYLRTGAIARFSPVMAAVQALADRGSPVLGICNGFQILAEAHLVPGALRRNEGLRFLCVWTELEVVDTNTIATRECEVGQRLRIPINHYEGNYTPPARSEPRIALRYVDNPNGAWHDAAGVANDAGNVVGMMPHPERASESWLGSEDGRLVLASLLESCRPDASAGSVVDPAELPGADLVSLGIADLFAGRLSVPSLLVSIGYPRLRRAGLEIAAAPIPSPEKRLYELLAAEDPRTAHSRYNALIRRLVSYERAAECAS